MPTNFWFLWIGFVVSTLGTYTSLIVTNCFIYNLTHSSLMVGIFLLTRLIPSLLIGSFAGVIADRFNRRYLMIIADIARALLIFSVIVFRNELYILYLIFLLIAVFDRFYQAAFGGGLPNIVGMDNLIKANAYIASGRTIAVIAGPILGGLLVALNRYNLAFSIDAVTYLVSALMVYMISAKLNHKILANNQRSWWADLKEGYIFVFTRYFLATALLLRTLDAFGSSVLSVGLPAFSNLLPELKASICYGLLIAAVGLGEMLGSFFLARLKICTLVAPEKLIGLSIAIMGLAFGIGMNMHHLTWAILFLFICGLAEGITVVHYNAIIQKNSDAIRSRIVGISETSIWSAMALGMFFSGLFIEYAGLAKIITLFSTTIFVGCSIFLVLSKNRLVKEPNM